MEFFFACSFSLNWSRIRSEDLRLAYQMRDFLVSLSFSGRQRDLVSKVAEVLTEALGPDTVFYDKYYEADLSRPNLDLYLQAIYHDHSQLVVVFLGRDYELSDWCGLEWRAVRDMIKSRRSDHIMLVRVDDGAVPGVLPIDGYIDARERSPGEIANLILQRFRRMHESMAANTASVTRPGILRHLLDRLCPRFHLWLTRAGALPQPPELPYIQSYLRELKSRIEHDIREKTYLPLLAKTLPQGSLESERTGDPFVRPIHQVIRQVLGRTEGGDSASVQITVVNRKSRLVKDIVRTLLRSPDPLVLLGDPGSGKTMTLQETALALVAGEIRRVFPRVVLYVRLGEFHVNGKVGSEDVQAFVKRFIPLPVESLIDNLDLEGRLVVLFDGMDEMSRDRYNEHTEALSKYAGSRQEGTKTLFSCRITDFSPAFLHRRLVLLPFDRSQITHFLRRYIPSRTLRIDHQTWSLSKLAQRLAVGDLPVDATNPFVLWLLCLFLQEEGTWPESRVQLLGYFSRKNYERKHRDAKAEGFELPPYEEAMREWAHFAYIITERNRGTAVPFEVLLKESGHSGSEFVRSIVRVGKWCGILAESLQEENYLIRFEHHRFQEYFAALWIHENRPRIDWLDKLDAPRWQETMLNLVTMGGAEDGVQTLVSSIQSEMAFLRLQRRAVDWEEDGEAMRRSLTWKTIRQLLIGH